MTPSPVRAKLSESAALSFDSADGGGAVYQPPFALREFVKRDRGRELRVLLPYDSRGEIVRPSVLLQLLNDHTLMEEQRKGHPGMCCGQCHDTLSALEARLAAAEGVAEDWRKVASTKHEADKRNYHDCADELSAILKGEK